MHVFSNLTCIILYSNHVFFHSLFFQGQRGSWVKNLTYHVHISETEINKPCNSANFFCCNFFDLFIYLLTHCCAVTIVCFMISITLDRYVYSLTNSLWTWCTWFEQHIFLYRYISIKKVSNKLSQKQNLIE